MKRVRRAQVVEDGVGRDLENVLRLLDLILIKVRFDQSAVEAYALSMQRHYMF